MYKSFHVKNFRCFKDLQINDLGRVNLIAGKNNTGKTALLEAMYIFTRPGLPQVLFELQGIRTGTLPSNFLEAIWKQFFHGMNASQTMEFSGHGKISDKRTCLTVQELMNSKDNAESFLKYFQHLTAHGVTPAEASGFISRANTMLELIHFDEEGIKRETHFLAESPIPVFTDVEQRSLLLPVRAEPNRQFVASQFSLADIGGELDFVEDVLKSFEPNIADLRLLSPFGEAEIWATIGKLQLPLSLMGGGVNQVCNLMLSMMIQPNYLLIDEIENGFHHSVLEEIWGAIRKLAAKKNVQVFATTHSLEMIKAANCAFRDDDVDDFRFHRLYRDPTTGNIEARTYNEYSIEAAISRDREVRG